MMMTRSSAMTLIAGSTLAAAVPVVAQTALTPVRIGAVPIDAMGVAFFGRDSGTFQSNGIDPQITALSGGSAIMSAVIGGTLDVGLANTVNVAAAIARNIPIVMIAPAALYSKRDAAPNLMIAKDSPIKAPKDLTGATLGISTLGGFEQLAMWAYLDANNIPRGSVKFAELKFGEMGPALQRGIVAAALLPEPARTDAINAGQVRDFGDAFISIAPEYTTVVWFATKDWVDKNPETVKKLVKGLYAAAQWSNTHTKESGDMLAKAAKMDPAVIASMGRMYFATTNDKKYIEPTLALATKYNLLARPITVKEFGGP